MVHMKIIIIIVLCFGLVTGASAQQELLNELNEQVMKLYQQGNYAEATKAAEKALEVARKSFGLDHLNVTTPQNNLASLYRLQGKYDEAELLEKRNLVIREKALGADHPDVATTLNNLALLYQSRGKYS